MSKCPELLDLELLTAGDLADERRSTVEFHIKRCQQCRDTLKELRADEALAASLRQMDWLRSAENPQLPVIDGYQVERLLSRGGQGMVFAGVQDSTCRPVAIKLLLATSFASSRHRKRFLREIEVVAQLHHPFIVTIHDSGETRDGLPFFAMELLPGGSLTDALGLPNLSIPEKIRGFLPVLEAVQFAHERGILHRDLKPGNVLLDSSGHPKVLDFGLARQLTIDAENTQVTQEGEFVGTLAYAAPEALDADPLRVDVRCDVYALGVLLYEILTGELPIRMEGSLLEVMRRIQEQEPLRPSVRNAAISGDLDAIVLQALARDPARRYAGVAALAQDLDRHLRGLPVLARSDSGWYVMRKTLWRHRLFASGLGIVFAATLVAAIISFQFWRQSEVDGQRKQRIAAWYRQMIEAPDPWNLGPDARVLDMLEQAAADFESHPEEDPEIAFELAFSMGKTFNGLGEYARGKVFLERAVELACRELGPEFERTLDARLALGNCLVGMGKFEVAQELLAPLLAEMPDEQVPATALQWRARSLQMSLHFEAGRLEEAEALGRALHAQALAALGREHRETRDITNSLSTILLAQGRYEEAEQMLRAELQSLRHEDPRKWTFHLHNLAQALSNLGRDEEAERALEECLELRVRVFGEEHDATNRARGNLALHYLYQGRFADAEVLLKQVIPIAEKHIGRNHPTTQNFLTNMAAVHRHFGRLDQSEELLREVLEQSSQRFGLEHPQTLTAMHNLGQFLIRRRDFEQSQELLESAWERRSLVLGDEHSATLQSHLSLAHVLHLQGEREPAIEHIREILDLAEPGRWRPDRRLEAHFILTQALLGEGRLEEAEEVLQEAGELVEEVQGDSSKLRSILSQLRDEWTRTQAR